MRIFLAIALAGCSAATSKAYDGSDAACNCDDANTGDPNVNLLAPNVFLVNAATAVGDVRICFEPNADPAQPSDVTVPQTNYPGLATGASVFFRNSFKVRGKTLTPFAVSASGPGAAEYGRPTYSCSELATNPLINRIQIAPVAINGNGPTILALVGCPAGVGNVARCGPAFDTIKGNLRFVEVYVGGTLVNGSIGAFVVNLSPSVAADVNGGSATSHLGSLSAPCSGNVIDKSALTLGAIGPAAQSVMRPTAFDAEGFAVCVQKSQMMPLLVRSYAQVQTATDPASLPADLFGKNADFVFTIVGDSTVQSGPEAAHVLAIAFEASN